MVERVKTCTKCIDEKPESEFPNEANRKDGKYPWCKSCLSQHRKDRYKKVPRKVWVTQKVCSRCKEWKPRELFRKYTGNNLHYRCIECEDKEHQLNLQEVTECSSCKKIKPNIEYYASRLKNRSRQCAECHKLYYKINFASKTDLTPRAPKYVNRRDQNLQKYFGITLEDYKTLLEKQSFLCPICLEPFEQDNYSYPVDHAHGGPNQGIIRAILHDRCNRFVMWKHTDPEQLRRTADLIENPLTDWFVPEEYVKSQRPKKKKRKKKCQK